VLTIVGGKPVYAAEEFETLAPAPPPVLPDWSPVAQFGGYAKPPVHAFSQMRTHGHKHSDMSEHRRFRLPLLGFLADPRKETYAHHQNRHNTRHFARIGLRRGRQSGCRGESAVRYNPTSTLHLRISTGCVAEPDCDVRRNSVEAGRLHRDTDSEQHHVATGFDSGRHASRCSDSKLRIPYPFGAERTGYLVTDLRRRDASRACRRRRCSGHSVRRSNRTDAIIQWPGGVNMQLYWHTTPPSYPGLQTIPENRVYVSTDRAAAFMRSFVAFSHAKVISDDPTRPASRLGGRRTRTGGFESNRSSAS